MVPETGATETVSPITGGASGSSAGSGVPVGSGATGAWLVTTVEVPSTLLVLVGGLLLEDRAVEGQGEHPVARDRGPGGVHGRHANVVVRVAGQLDVR